MADTYSSNEYQGIRGCALNHSFLILSTGFGLLLSQPDTKNRPPRKNRLSSEAPDRKQAREIRKFTCSDLALEVVWPFDAKDVCQFQECWKLGNNKEPKT